MEACNVSDREGGIQRRLDVVPRHFDPIRLNAPGIQSRKQTREQDGQGQSIPQPPWVGHVRAQVTAHAGGVLDVLVGLRVAADVNARFRTRSSRIRRSSP